MGANAPGIISPIGKCRIGFQPLPTFTPGRVGIVAKSGTLSYETVASLTRAGIGQSLCIGMGGDVVAGTNFVDALNVFEHDKDTEGMILVGEVGGTAEEEAAEWIRQYKQRVKYSKLVDADTQWEKYYTDNQQANCRSGSRYLCQTASSDGSRRSLGRTRRRQCKNQVERSRVCRCDHGGSSGKIWRHHVGTSFSEWPKHAQNCEYPAMSLNLKY